MAADAYLGMTVGRYVVDSELGRGGMGVVYRGRQLSLGRPVAIKVLPPTVDGHDSVGRLLQEASAIASLAHENIVYVYDVGQVASMTYVVMELLDGTSLR